MADDNKPADSPTYPIRVKSHHLALALVIVGALLVFHFRRKLAERFEVWRNNRRWSRLAVNGGFESDLENGFSSANFDINENIRNHDPRTLDEAAKDEIRRLMLQHNLSFDDARVRYLRERFEANNVDASGMPLDPKTVTFGH